MGKSQVSPDDQLTSRQAAAELGIGLSRLQTLIAEGRLPATRFGWAWVIRRGDLELVRNRPHGKHLTDWREKKQAKPDEKKKKT